MKNNQGFTLIEVLIYVSLTSVIVGLLGSILVTMTRVQSQQGASTDINTELDFLVSTIKREIRDAKVINSVSKESINIITNRNPGGSTIIEKAVGSNIIEIEVIGERESITSQDIIIDDLTFTFFDAPVIGNTIGISITATNNNIEQESVTKTIQSSAQPLLLD